ncbi:MAG: type II methionyl aminopeptidase [Nanohaloarchaea archaeon]|nr:type II methionyl aminopeptidase [Candidatus Nanohaloarchaea archaeon]
MDDTTYDNYIRAGKIASRVLADMRKKVVSGATYLDIVQQTEQMITDAGAQLACPATLSVNTIAAHYTPLLNDISTIGDKDVVKLDIGVMVEGCIADTATTICLDPAYDDMNNAAKSALEKALKLATPGTNVGEIGAVIESEIISRGYRPIVNLSGHILSSYELHSGFSIPNIKTDTNDTLEEDMVLAIEPFATDGQGMIKEISKIQIFRHIAQKPTRLPAARKVLSLAKTKYHSMPFTPRWITDISPFMLDSALRQLSDSNAIYMYPVLKEAGDGIVTQAEHTVIVRDRPVVTTRI